MTGEDSEMPTLAESPAPAPRILPTGSSVGRYTVLGRIGSGGMGVVYSAYDPELDRKVAIKLLRSEAGDASGGRLLHEAQAMARLNHPNVIAVHDVGTVDGAVFVAMEYVHGPTLAAWLRSDTRTRREILAVFAQAGRGLAAAHESGLVHRDFKPDNVLVGRDGQVRVTDFGLARATAREPADDPDEPSDAALSSRSGSIAAVDVTGAGAGRIVGTPAYMAPEQYLGEDVDARADQFAFCVALWEALVGQRPFRGDTIPQLAIEVTQGAVLPLPTGVRLPAWLRRALLRGLRPDPAQRWPTMSVLLHELGRDRVARVRRLGAGLALAACAGGIGFALAGAEDRDACEGAAQHLVGVWDPASRERIEAAFRATRAADAAATWERVAYWIDGWTAEWLEQYRDACETARRGEQSDRMLDARMRCLQSRMHELRGLVEVLGAADVPVLRGAVQQAANLRAVGRCGDLEAMRLAVAAPEDPGVVEAVERIRAELARAQALATTRPAQVLPGLERTIADCRELGYPPVLAEALYAGAIAHLRTGDYATARRRLEESYFVAAMGHDLSAAASAAGELVYLLAEPAQAPEAAAEWLRHLEVADELSGSDPELRGRLHAYRAYVARATGDHAAAVAHFERAVEQAERESGFQDPNTGTAVNNVAVTLDALGRFDEAMVQHERALAIKQSSLGPDHPSVGLAHSNVGNAWRRRGDPMRAIEHQRRALQIFEATYPEGSPWIAFPLNNLADALHDARQDDEARELLRRALTIREGTLPPGHAHIGYTKRSLGRVETAAGNLELAIPMLESALEIHAAAPDPTELADTKLALAQALQRAGTDPPRTLRLAQEARPALAAAPGRQTELLAVDALLRELSG